MCKDSSKKKIFKHIFGLMRMSRAKVACTYKMKNLVVDTKIKNEAKKSFRFCFVLFHFMRLTSKIRSFAM